MYKTINRLKNKFAAFTLKTKMILLNNRGDGYIDVAIRILIAVVLGSLLLAGLYLLFGETVLPELTRRIKDMFNYNG